MKKAVFEYSKYPVFRKKAELLGKMGDVFVIPHHANWKNINTFFEAVNEWKR